MTGYPETGPLPLKRFLPRARPSALCGTHRQGMCPRARGGGSLVLSFLWVTAQRSTEIGGSRFFARILWHALISVEPHSSRGKGGDLVHRGFLSKCPHSRKSRSRKRSAN